MAEERAPARKFRDLIVWRKAHEFVLDGKTEELAKLLEEVSRLLNAYSKAIGANAL